MCLLFLFPFQLVKQLFYSYFLYLLFFPFHIPFSYFKIPPPFSSFFSFFFFKASGYLVTGWIVGRQWLPSLGETARPGMATDNKKERKRKNKKKKKNKKEDTSCIAYTHTPIHVVRLVRFVCLSCLAFVYPAFSRGCLSLLYRCFFSVVSKIDSSPYLLLYTFFSLYGREMEFPVSLRGRLCLVLSIYLPVACLFACLLVCSALVFRLPNL